MLQSLTMEQPVSQRALAKRTAAATSRQNKIQEIGREKYLQEKRDAEADRQKRLKIAKAVSAAAAATAAAREAADAARPVQPQQPPVFDIAGQIAQLGELKARGVINEAQFAAAMAKVLAMPPTAAAVP